MWLLIDVELWMCFKHLDLIFLTIQGRCSNSPNPPFHLHKVSTVGTACLPKLAIQERPNLRRASSFFASASSKCKHATIIRSCNAYSERPVWLSQQKLSMDLLKLAAHFDACVKYQKEMLCLLLLFLLLQTACASTQLLGYVPSQWDSHM